MQFLNDYVTGIVVVSLLTLILENLLPQGSHKKYISTIIGLLVMLVILKPLTALPHYAETFSVPVLDETEMDNETNMKPYVVTNFEKNLALSITQDVYHTFGETIQCRVRCEVNEEGQITSIRSVHLEPYQQDVAKFVAGRYGIEEASIRQ